MVDPEEQPVGTKKGEMSLALKAEGKFVRARDVPPKLPKGSATRGALRGSRHFGGM